METKRLCAQLDDALASSFSGTPFRMLEMAKELLWSAQAAETEGKSATAMDYRALAAYIRRSAQQYLATCRECKQQYVKPAFGIDDGHCASCHIEAENFYRNMQLADRIA